MSFPFLQSYLGLSSGLQTRQASAGGAVGGWVELGRTTLGSANASINVSSLANKRYYMILTNIKGKNNSGVNWQTRMGNSAIDTGSNYSMRYSLDGGADSSGTSQTEIQSGTNPTDLPQFEVGYISNYSTKEKLFMAHDVNQNTAGAGTAPQRGEYIGKWVNTSNAVDIIGATTGSAYTFNSGSEVVVLGWDPADTHTTNFWTELTSKDFTGTADTVTTDSFTAKKYLWIQVYVEGTSSLREGTFRVNGDSGSNYAIRRNLNSASEDTFASIDAIKPQGGSNVTNYFANIFAINNSANEKLFIEHIVSSATAGAGTAPLRHEVVGKWANTASQITSFSVFNDDSGDLTDVKIRVWGSD